MVNSMASVYFITGTDTGVGKTVLTALLVRHLRDSGIQSMAVKPLCAGGRDDARQLRRAQASEYSLDEINPWHMRAPMAPLLAARRERQTISRSEVLRYLRATAGKCEVLLVEGAGGLLSPLGEDFDARDLIVDLKAIPVIVGPNRLGAVNQVRLVLAALPPAVRRHSRVLLMRTGRSNLATKTNEALLAEYFDRSRMAVIPHVEWPAVLGRHRVPEHLSRAFRVLGFRTGS